MPIVLLLILVLICLVIRSIVKKRDRCGWGPQSKPNINATIQNISSEAVRMGKNDYRYETTVLFSDGFYYITYLTERVEGFLSYKISLSPGMKEQIMNKATKKHNDNINKLIKKLQKKGSSNNGKTTI